MDDFFVAPVTHVIPMTTIRRERALPVPGTITARVNEKVQATHVVAEAAPTPRHRFLDIARGLGVGARQADRFLVCERGDRLEEGDVIAGPLGLARRTIRAPGDGRIVAIERGRVLYEMQGDPHRLRAGFPGKVIATDGSRKVTVETQGALIQGVWGNGREDYGLMRMVSEDRAARLQTGQLDINFRGAILVAGVCDHPAPLHQATELAVRGVILGSIDSELISIARRLPYPLLVTEGFGRRPINQPAFNLLMNNAGREMAIHAHPIRADSNQRPELIIPLAPNHPTELPDEVITLMPGTQVRILRAPLHGQVGIIREVLSQSFLFPSGIRARSATVDLEEGGTTTVPLANLDVLQ
jgi:hypothetical protein